MDRILITSALPYINGVKHLGNLVGSMLPADVYARFQRARGREVLALCATDEHGTPAELAARAAGQSVAAFCAEQHAIQKDLGERFGLSWDWFGRSSSPQNHELTQHFARRLWENGHLEIRTTSQVYSLADARFLPDRYVVGTCPHCGYDRARGDQCENCTRVLDPTDLIAPRSALSGSPDIEIRDSAHLFLKQSAFADDLRAWIDSNAGEWPNVVTGIAYKWLDEGLKDRGITRDLEWGVKVPAGIADNRLAGKVFYVWFDAPIEYIAAAREWSDAGGGDWQRWWCTDKGADDVRYVQFMAKDNVPFHTVGFPVTLMGSGEPWKRVDTIKGFNWLTYYGGKFSTSEKRGVFMDAALDLLPADYWRWYLMANAPEGQDASFTWEHFQSVVNKDLADVLGNFVNRILKFTAARFGEAVPEGGAPGAAEAALAQTLERQIGLVTAHLEEMQFRRAAAELRAAWVAGNEYLAVAAPWTQIRDSREAAAQTCRTAINLIALFARLSRPFIPHTAQTMLHALSLDPGSDTWPAGSVAEALGEVPAGQTFKVPPVLFQKITDEQRAEWEARFGSGQTAV